MMAVAFTGHASAAVPVDWVVGDVFVAVGNGKYQVWHRQRVCCEPAISADPDNLGYERYGGDAGCAFDSAYRLFGTDFTNSRAVRFTINNEHPVSQAIPAARRDSVIRNRSRSTARETSIPVTLRAA